MFGSMLATGTEFGLRHTDMEEPPVPARTVTRILALSAQGASPSELAAIFRIDEQTITALIKGKLPGYRTAHDQFVNLGKVKYAHTFGDVSDRDKLAALRLNKP